MREKYAMASRRLTFRAGTGRKVELSFTPPTGKEPVYLWLECGSCT